MNLYTYLRIKQAAGPRYASDATPEEIAEWSNNELAGQNALKQVPELQAQLDEAIGKNNKYYFDNEQNESNWQNYMTDVNKQIDQLKSDLNYAQLDNYVNSEIRTRLEDRNIALNNTLGDRVKDLRKAEAKNRGRANTIRRQEEQLANQASMLADNENSMNRMRRNASIGGAVGGATIGGGVGYAGTNWLANKLKLTGRKALAAKLLGTAAGSALGGAGGYYLGQNI